MWRENTEPVTREESIDFFPSYTYPAVIIFKYIQVLEFLSSWGLNFVHAWHVETKMLGMR